MGKWTDILDANVAASDSEATHIAALRMPKLAGWEPGRVWASWPVDSELLIPMGTVFGGYLAAMADHFMANALFTVLGDDEAVSTTDLHMNFLRPIRDGVVTIEATILHRGRRTAHCEARFTDASGSLLARAGATELILPAR